MTSALAHKVDGNCMYGTIYLGDCEFAIAADRIVEVVNRPSTMEHVPLSAPFVRGTFDLRGTIITVIDLTYLFGRTRPDSTSEKIAVLEYGEQLVGIVFDGIGRVFRGQRKDFSEFDSDSSNPFIAGMFRLSGGAKLVHVIDVEGLFKQSGVPKEVSRKQGELANSRGHDRGQKIQYLMFSLGENRCAIPVKEIQEVFRLDRVTRTPLSGGKSCLGTTNLRDGNLPILDLLALLGGKTLSLDHEQVTNKDVVAMQVDSVLFGMTVDSIDDIFFAYDDEIVRFPPSELIRQDMFVGCVLKDHSTQVLIFDHRALVANEEINKVTKVHGKLASSPLKRRSKKVDKHEDIEQSFLTFYGGSRYAVRLNEVKEIIDLPSQLLKPPGLSNGFLGVYNLRNQMSVAIVDLTQPELGDNSVTQNRKVMIFDAKGGKGGLVIDSLDSIVSVKEDNILKSDDLLSGFCSVHSNELIRIKESSGRTASIPVVDLPTIFEDASMKSAELNASFA